MSSVQPVHGVTAEFYFSYRGQSYWWCCYKLLHRGVTLHLLPGRTGPIFTWLRTQGLSCIMGQMLWGSWRFWRGGNFPTALPVLWNVQRGRRMVLCCLRAGVGSAGGRRIWCRGGGNMRLYAQYFLHRSLYSSMGASEWWKWMLGGLPLWLFPQILVTRS